MPIFLNLLTFFLLIATVQFAFTRRAPFPATPHVGFSARPVPSRSGLASPHRVWCLELSPNGNCRQSPPSGALVNYIVWTVRRSTTSLSFPTAVRSPQLARRGRHCSGPLHFGNDRSHKEYFAPFAPHSCHCEVASIHRLIRHQPREMLIFHRWRHATWLARCPRLPKLATPRWSPGHWELPISARFNPLEAIFPIWENAYSPCLISGAGL